MAKPLHVYRQTSQRDRTAGDVTQADETRQVVAQRLRADLESAMVAAKVRNLPKLHKAALAMNKQFSALPGKELEAWEPTMDDKRHLKALMQATTNLRKLASGIAKFEDAKSLTKRQAKTLLAETKQAKALGVADRVTPAIVVDITSAVLTFALVLTKLLRQRR